MERFAARGYNAASMDEMAEAAAVSKPVLYQHFESKLDLYLVVLQQAADSLTERLSAAIALPASNKYRMQATVRALFAFVDDHPHEFSVLFRADSYEPQALRVVHSVRLKMSHMIGEIVQRSTELSWNEALVVGRSVMQMGEGAAVALSEDPDLDRDHIAEVISDVLWTGFGGLPYAAEVPDENQPSADRPAHGRARD
ncbi:transcriptional regulator, TetR family [Brevibacterium jeotgali]|uniref:Transcriptional regulator, TetR family n=2 Tax=Brevibacterium jeotgali TaxID=1262550 RepID=A0A2H1L867_9MICO|nr:transcriptional regulator, TetR family [Brevibacterium jeotgali]